MKWRWPRWLRRKHTDTNTVTPIRTPYRLGSKFGWVTESFGGSWQRNLALSSEDVLAFSAVFACVSLISGDIAKLRLCVKRRTRDGIWEEAEQSAYDRLLRKPNRFQTRLQFIRYWVAQKLIDGNTYVLKERDARGVVRALYITDGRTQPLVAPDGQVYYRIRTDRLSGVPGDEITVPASEIIHDRAECLFHPLVGVSPLYAAMMAATQGNRIQSNSQTFFENMSRPSGQLTAPGTISDETAARLKSQFESGFTGQQLGRLFVSGDGLKFEPFTIPAEQAQMIEQLRWTGEDVARAFLVPAYKLGLGPTPALGHVAALNQEYFQQVLQVNIEAIEDLMDDGLDLPASMGVEFDVESLLRMDPKTRAEVAQIETGAGILAPDEARRARNLAPVPGGKHPYLQQQNYSLEALAKRDAQEDPFKAPGSGGQGPAATSPKPGDPPPDDPEDEVADDVAAAFLGALEKELA